MKISIDQDRFCRFIRMLIHLAGGDFSIRIPIEEKRDQFQVAEIVANKLAVENDQIFKHTAFLKPKSSRDFLQHLSIDLSQDFTIVNANTSARELLASESNELEGRRFRDLLNKKSQKKWTKFKKHLRLPFTVPPIVKLRLLNPTGMEIPTYCQVDEIVNMEGYAFRVNSIISGLHEEFIFRKEEEAKAKAFKKNPNPKPLPVMERPVDLDRVYKLRDYIIENSEGPLPKGPELALMHDTNETKLRNDFKEQLGLTPPELHTWIRFINAKLVIETSTGTLSEAIRDLQFVNYSAFCTTFKDLFGYSPKIARKRARSMEE